MCLCLFDRAWRNQTTAGREDLFAVFVCLSDRGGLDRTPAGGANLKRLCVCLTKPGVCMFDGEAC